MTSGYLDYITQRALLLRDSQLETSSPTFQQHPSNVSIPPIAIMPGEQTKFLGYALTGIQTIHYLLPSVNYRRQTLPSGMTSRSLSSNPRRSSHRMSRSRSLTAAFAAQTFTR